VRSLAKLFITTALLEVSAGLALICVPVLAIRVLLGIREPSPEALVVSRVCGAALLAIGVACWIARHDYGSRSQRGLLWGVLIYDVGACIVLAIAGSIMRMSGVVLWPAVTLHGALTLWCVASLLASGANA
jgi:hypothetical protein